jgi:hypothetical protein
MPTYKAQDEKARQTDKAVAAILEVERQERERKTAKLRALRLARGDDRPDLTSEASIQVQGARRSRATTRSPNMKLQAVRTTMRRIEFDTPVKVSLGKPRRSTLVRTTVEAARCLESESWPARDKPLSRIAAKALDAASRGHVTPAEAREAFADAALEAHVLVVGASKH